MLVPETFVPIGNIVISAMPYLDTCLEALASPGTVITQRSVREQLRKLATEPAPKQLPVAYYHAATGPVAHGLAEFTPRFFDAWAFLCVFSKQQDGEPGLLLLDGSENVFVFGKEFLSITRDTQDDVWEVDIGFRYQHFRQGARLFIPGTH